MKPWPEGHGNAVVAGARQWRPQVNGRKNNNKIKLLGRAEFTRRPGALKRSVLEWYVIIKKLVYVSILVLQNNKKIFL
jgi:hypothetical protein